MKKFLAVLVLSIILFAQTGFVLAVSEGEECNCSNAACSNDDCDDGLKCFCDPDGDGDEKGVCHPAGSVVLCPPSKYTKIEDLIEGITNWIFYIGIVVAPLMIVVGAFMFMTSAGDPAKVQTAKKLIIWTIIGLAIILLSKGLISLIKFILGA